MTFLMINSPLLRDPSCDDYDEVLPPLGLWYICTNLREKWFDVELLDAVASKLSVEEIIDYIEHGNYSYVGFNIFSTNHKIVEEIVAWVERDVDFYIWWAYTKTNAHEIINWETLNKINVIIWEADIALSDIILWEVQESFEYLQGRRRVFRVDKYSQYFVNDLSSLPLDRTFFEYEPTNSQVGQLKEGNIVVSRGCVYDCTFCSAAISLNNDVNIRKRSPEDVQGEIWEICRIHPDVQSIRVLDDLFLANKKAVFEAIQIFSEFKLNWRAMAHIKTFKSLDDSLVEEIRKSWCLELSIWIESWDDMILQSIKKGNNVAQILDTIERIFNAWVSVKWYFMIWFPWETYEQFERTYKLARNLKELSLFYDVGFRISVFQFRPYHGTQIYYDLLNQWYSIEDIIPDSSKWASRVWEYDFSGGNMSSESDAMVNNVISNIRRLNDLSDSFIPYYDSWVLEEMPWGCVFFVGLSYKLWKENEVLESFSWSTSSGKVIDAIVSRLWWISVYKTNLAQWVPINAETWKIRYPSQEEKRKGVQCLLEAIHTKQPKQVFLFWKQVSDFVIRFLSPDQVSNQEYRYGQTRLICVEHPAYISVYKRHQLDDYISNIVWEIVGDA